MERINIVISINDKTGDYSRHTGVLLISIFKHTNSNICIHLLHDDTLSDDNKMKFIEIANLFKQEIRFYLVELDKKIANISGLERVSKATLFRLYAGEVLNLDKCIYLDSDIIVTIDIRCLWKIFNDDILIGGVLDSIDYRKVIKRVNIYKKLNFDSDKYINAGVLLLNLKRLKMCNKDLTMCIDFLIKYKDLPAADQDAINYCYKDDITLLDNKYNIVVNEYFTYHINKYSEKSRYIWHFAGFNKPWNSIIYPVDKLYWKYLLESPWCTDKKQIINYIQNINKFTTLENVILDRKIGSKRLFIKNFFVRMYKLLFYNK